jgi:hypothetical protein
MIDEDALEQLFYSHFTALTREAQKEIIKKLKGIMGDKYWKRKDEERERILKAGIGLVKDDMDRETV